MNMYNQKTIYWVDPSCACEGKSVYFAEGKGGWRD